MRLNEAEISFNQTWLFLQFKIYEMNFETMHNLMCDLRDGNKSPFEGTTPPEWNKCIFKEDDYSNRTRGCVLLQIQLEKRHYEFLKQTMPLNEISPSEIG